MSILRILLCWWGLGAAIGLGESSWEKWAFRPETCLAPAGHYDPPPPFSMYNLISSPVTLPLCLPIFLLHLEMGPKVTQLGGEGRGSQNSWAGAPWQVSLQRPQLPKPTPCSNLSPGEGDRPPALTGCPFFLLRNRSLSLCLVPPREIQFSNLSTSLSFYSTSWGLLHPSPHPDGKVVRTPPTFQDQGNYFQKYFDPK